MSAKTIILIASVLAPVASGAPVGQATHLSAPGSAQPLFHLNVAGPGSHWLEARSVPSEYKFTVNPKQSLGPGTGQAGKGVKFAAWKGDGSLMSLNEVQVLLDSHVKDLNASMAQNPQAPQAPKVQPAGGGGCSGGACYALPKAGSSKSSARVGQSSASHRGGHGPAHPRGGHSSNHRGGHSSANNRAAKKPAHHRAGKSRHRIGKRSGAEPF